MQNSIWTITALVTLTAAPAIQAKETSREETIGVGTGALVGAIAGGPVGLVAGIAIGGTLGDNLHDRNTRIDTLTTTLDASREEIDELTVDVQRLRRDAGAARADVRRLEQSIHPELTSLMQSGIESDWLFRTDESELIGSAATRLGEMAESLATMPDIRIHLDGYADPRGDADYNQALSAQRVEWIEAQLIAAGIAPERISSMAHGEVSSVAEDSDSLALERRVSLKVFIEPASSLASNSE